MKIRIAHTNPNALTDGPGRRFSIYFQGCSLRCPGCQSPDLWDAGGGREVEVEDLAAEALASGLPVSILGGEPFDQPGALYSLLFWLRAERGFADDTFIIVYTGYTFEALAARGDETIDGVLALADVIVDGPFIADLDHDRLQYRGSANQRVIDTSTTLARGPDALARHGPVMRDWDAPELLITPAGDILAAEGLAEQFAALGEQAPARRCGEVA